MDQAARGAAALSASKYDEAIEHYTKALQQNPGAVDYYIKRSTAYQRTSKYTEALTDAEKAVVFAHKRARRELIKDSQLRRAIALFFLGQYANAKFVLDIVKDMDDKEKTLAIWESKIATKMKEIPEGDEQREVTAKSVPDAPVDAPPAPQKDNGPVDTRPSATTHVLATPTEKPKHDWYQNNEQVTFTLLAKNVPKDKATVEIEKDSLDITYPLPNGRSFNFNLLPFYGEVDASSSSYRITPTKIEVVLKKATQGVKWKALEGELKREEPQSRLPSGEDDITGAVADRTRNTIEEAPSYPTSSKKGVKNWDKVAAEAGEEDDNDGDETSRFFKQLYKGAGEDAQRAMMKSYQESGGTVLSTDWSSVGKKYVAPEPPEGMEAKEY
jgi:suppressor of G2 allele of SKP1